MLCPKCYSEAAPVTTINGDSIDVTHYICLNPKCENEEGERTQFKFMIEDEIEFPYNVIFKKRMEEQKKREKIWFYRKPYLVLTPHGLESLGYRDQSSST